MFIKVADQRGVSIRLIKELAEPAIQIVRELARASSCWRISAGVTRSKSLACIARKIPIVVSMSWRASSAPSAIPDSFAVIFHCSSVKGNLGNGRVWSTPERTSAAGRFLALRFGIATHTPAAKAAYDKRHCNEGGRARSRPPLCFRDNNRALYFSVSQRHDRFVITDTKCREMRADRVSDIGRR